MEDLPRTVHTESSPQRPSSKPVGYASSTMAPLTRRHVALHRAERRAEIATEQAFPFYAPRGRRERERERERASLLPPALLLSLPSAEEEEEEREVMESVASNSIGENHTPPRRAEKVIIDTDPGIDDSMAIMMAFQSPDVEVIGLTTIFGNVTTVNATRNALLLCEIAGRPDIPVAEGSHDPLKKGKPRLAEFAHGSDGLGNINLPSPLGRKAEKSASEFLVDKVSEYPGDVSVLALGPLTNIALAIKRDSTFTSKVRRLVILGGSFFASGNVNPAAESNIYGDPEAADIVFTCGAEIFVVGINITTQVQLTDTDLIELRKSKVKHLQLLGDMCNFYRDWHVKSDGICGIFLHDPVSFVALVRPDLFTFKKGVVRVETQGICMGHTLMDQGLKKWNASNPWSGYSPISVAWTVDVPRILAFIKNILMGS